MDIVEVIKNRRSIRAFMARDVSKEDVLSLVDAAR
jgi:nitroreductase